MRVIKIIFVLSILFFISCETLKSVGNQLLNPFASDSGEVNYKSCSSDDECTYVSSGCCDCVNIGEEEAINKNYLEQFKKELSCDADECKDKVRIPGCGENKVRCIKNECTYTEKTDKPLTGVEIMIYNGCRMNSDCVRATNGCCECSGANSEIAIDYKYLELLKSRFDCAGVECNVDVRNGSTCGCGVLECKDGICIYNKDGCK